MAARLGLVLAIMAPLAHAAPSASACGEVVTLPSHDDSSTRYALAHPQGPSASGGEIALVLLVGGRGHLDLDDRGCPRALAGNFLVRSLPLFHGEGFITALVDAPSDHGGEDGLMGFRSMPQHADDLGKVIADLRARTHAQVWLVGTSRGTISAVNAAARLAGPAAPDGLVLTSALMSGQSGARKPWVADTVFDLQLESIRVPLLVIGHAADKCVRSPPGFMGGLAARTRSGRRQVVTVEGGPADSGLRGVDACEARAPHGYLDQEAEVAAGIGRFIRGGNY